jgi:RNA polymerase sigma-70 factor (ECF subfamily)
MNPRDPITPTDADLMAAFAAGDAHAFERLYARHEAALYRFVRRVLGTAAAAQADEVFQDTWERVIAARNAARHGWCADHERGASVRTWLFSIAHHRAVDCLRRSGRERALPEDDEGSPWEPGDAPWQDWPATGPAAATPEETAFWRAAGQRLLECLDGLPLAQRSAFLLHHEDGLGLADVARALEVGLETAKTRLRYAMSKLRACMGAYLPASSLQRTEHPR